jgi:hypothetical protein
MKRIGVNQDSSPAKGGLRMTHKNHFCLYLMLQAEPISLMM